VSALTLPSSKLSEMLAGRGAVLRSYSSSLADSSSSEMSSSELMVNCIVRVD
jgi:hypothetical protein